ncbi:hypothetical protein [Leptolyngbya sp. PCC 6406]|uniref:hypothetical protein n=1 Tax=Leptolyngbya sp. PCC 6406 TaxID=1173264 RepID=UPI0002AC935A|nr:hypothetical protein [Leptolyngbya sp. PCC 6406]
MFLDELTPFVQELTRQPIAFIGGFTSGLLRLNLNEDPLKSWLDTQAGAPDGGGDNFPPPPSDGPQKISID